MKALEPRTCTTIITYVIMVVHVLGSKAFMLQIVPLVYVIMVVHVLVSKAFMLQIAPLVYVVMVVHVLVSKAFTICNMKALEPRTCTTIIT
jgi:uncharacterized membrane protein YjdF